MKANTGSHRFLKIIFSIFTLGFGSITSLASSATPVELERVDRIPTELVDAFNVQIKSELDGAHFYLGLANHFYERSLDGFGHWFTQQYYEELNHARLMMDYLKKKNAQVVLSSVDTPPSLPSTEPLAIMEQSLGVEQTQSERIAALQAVALSLQIRDAGTFLQWFIDEQVEEEDSFQNVIDRLKLTQNSQEGLLLIDKELALRPAAVIWANGQPLPPH
jgi:ferritin